MSPQGRENILLRMQFAQDLFGVSNPALVVGQIAGLSRQQVAALAGLRVFHAR